MHARAVPCQHHSNCYLTLRGSFTNHIHKYTLSDKTHDKNALRPPLYSSLVCKINNAVNIVSRTSEVKQCIKGHLHSDVTKHIQFHNCTRVCMSSRCMSSSKSAQWCECPMNDNYFSSLCLQQVGEGIVKFRKVTVMGEHGPAQWEPKSCSEVP